eukprot:gene12230-15368_t
MLASLSKVYRPAFIAARQSRSASLLERGSVRMSATAAAQAVDPKAGAILNYWFGDDWATQSRYHGDQSSFGKWFKGSAEMDKEIQDLFGQDHKDMMEGKLDHWKGQPYNTLAAIILLDQFTRQLYRNSPIATKGHEEFPRMFMVFVHMPLMHSEVLADLEECVARTEAVQEDCEKATATHPNAETCAKVFSFNADYGKRHLAIVKKYGRYPHRNALLGRESTPEEIAGLEDGSIEKF